LPAWLEAALAEAGGSFSALARIVVGVGPGSFTGIRIAMAFAQGLAFPRSLPLHGFTSLSALLLSGPASLSGPVVAAIPANSGCFYAATGLEDPGSLIEAASLRRLGEQGAHLVVHENGPAWDAVRNAFAGVEIAGERIDFTAVARHAQASGRDARHPHYIQAPAAEARRTVT
jgi:tRNA threonylcarbamoyladenosine biosynthesis protein TsaB